jgi:hypothetical protein
MAEIIIAKVYGVTRDAIGAIVFLHRPVGTEIDSSTKIRIDSLIFSEDQMAYAFTEHIEIRGSGKALVRYGDSVQLTINPDPASWTDGQGTAQTRKDKAYYWAPDYALC